MNIIQAIRDEQLFRPFLADRNDRLDTWRQWCDALKVLYGVRLPSSKKRRKAIRACTGRKCAGMPKQGFTSALFLTGRRCGKSRIASVIGAFEAVLAGHETKLAKGEKGMVAICSPTKKQSRNVKNYLRGVFQCPLLEGEVVSETREGFELKNGVQIEMLAGDFRTVRGFTLLAAIVDEAAFFGVEEETKIKSDTELVTALKPALATVGGKLIAITTPYARKGWTFQTYQKHFGVEGARTLVWNFASTVMNPTLPQEVIDEALEEDLAKGRAEYFGEFRDDVAAFLPREVIERLVVKHRYELLPADGVRYVAHVDVSGGRHDDAAFAIAHREGRKVIVDLIRRYRAPFSPYEVIQRIADELRKYRITKCVGDAYGANFCETAFRECGIRYVKSELPASGLYLELLPRLCSGDIELPDDALLVDQLASLERRTRSGGKDIVDHPPRGHDDVANAVAGAVFLAFTRVLRIGAWLSESFQSGEN